jgi:hypothetical protein
LMREARMSLIEYTAHRSPLTREDKEQRLMVRVGGGPREPITTRRDGSMTRCSVGSVEEKRHEHQIGSSDVL